MTRRAVVVQLWRQVGYAAGLPHPRETRMHGNAQRGSPENGKLEQNRHRLLEQLLELLQEPRRNRAIERAMVR